MPYFLVLPRTCKHGVVDTLRGCLGLVVRSGVAFSLSQMEATVQHVVKVMGEDKKRLQERVNALEEAHERLAVPAHRPLPHPSRPTVDTSVNVCANAGRAASKPMATI